MKISILNGFWNILQSSFSARWMSLEVNQPDMMPTWPHLQFFFFKLSTNWSPSIPGMSKSVRITSVQDWFLVHQHSGNIWSGQIVGLGKANTSYPRYVNDSDRTLRTVSLSSNRIILSLPLRYILAPAKNQGSMRSSAKKPDVLVLVVVFYSTDRDNSTKPLSPLGAGLIWNGFSWIRLASTLALSIK